MRYLFFLLGFMLLTVTSCADETLIENEELQKIEKEDYEVPVNGIKSIEKDEYQIPDNG